MAVKTIEYIKSRFMRYLRPSQQDFHDWIDSFWHKEDVIEFEGKSLSENDFTDEYRAKLDGAASQTDLTAEAATRGSTDATLQANIDAHTARTDNPHTVTKSQVGLGNVTNDAQIKRVEMAVANGVPTLDSNAKVPLSQMNDALLGNVNYQDTWNAATNTPTLSATPEVKGHYYIVSAAGTQFGITFAVGDWIISNGNVWKKVNNTDAVSSVNGRTGNVTGLAERTELEEHTSNEDIHVTQVEKDYWNSGGSRNIINTETATGRTYNGVPTYIRRFSGVIVASANTLENTMLIPKISSIIGIGGWIQNGKNDYKFPLNTVIDENSFFDTTLKSHIFIIGNTGNNDICLFSISSSTRSGVTNNAYDIWIEYTKISLY